MRVGSFSLSVVPGRERDTGHVIVNHGQQYTIRMSSHHHRRSDARVIVDGKEIGVFRLAPHQQMVLERSPHDSGCFTFYKAGSSEAEACKVASVSSVDRGVIQVVFNVERRPSPLYIPITTPFIGTPILPQNQFFCGGGAAGPGFVGQTSNVEYSVPDMAKGFEREEKTSGGIRLPDSGVQCHNLGSAGITGLSGHSNQQFVNVEGIEYDLLETTTISLRLVADAEPRPLLPRTLSNPVPAPM